MNAHEKIKDWKNIALSQDNNVAITQNLDDIEKLSYFELGIYGIEYNIIPDSFLQLRLYPDVIEKEIYEKHIKTQHPEISYRFSGDRGGIGAPDKFLTYKVYANVIFDDKISRISTFYQDPFGSSTSTVFMNFGNIYIPNDVRKISIWFEIYDSGSTFYISNYGQNYNIYL
jgi:hypothetical protein